MAAPTKGCFCQRRQPFFIAWVDRQYFKNWLCGHWLIEAMTNKGVLEGLVQLLSEWYYGKIDAIDRCLQNLPRTP